MMCNRVPRLADADRFSSSATCRGCVVTDEEDREGDDMRPLSAGRAGLLEPIVLAAMASQTLYGYLLRRKVQEMSGGALSVDPGSMYRLLRRLEQDGAVESAWASGEFGPQRRVYTLTERGKGLLACWRDFLVEQQRLHQAIIDTIDRTLEPAGDV